MSYIRTDLAVEANEQHAKGSGVEGVTVDVREEDGRVNVTTVDVTNEAGSKSIGKDIGAYITVDAMGNEKKGADLKKKITEVLAGELSKLIDEYKDKGVLIVGLGN